MAVSLMRLVAMPHPGDAPIACAPRQKRMGASTDGAGEVSSYSGNVISGVVEAQVSKQIVHWWQDCVLKTNEQRRVVGGSLGISGWTSPLAPRSPSRGLLHGDVERHEGSGCLLLVRCSSLTSGWVNLDDSKLLESRGGLSPRMTSLRLKQFAGSLM